jgi:hypothetical protein
MIFQEGSFYIYNGSKRKVSKTFKCTYVGHNISVLAPLLDDGTYGDGFSISTDCKYYILDPDHNTAIHQAMYFQKLRDHYANERATLLDKVNGLDKLIFQTDEHIDYLKNNQAL